MEISLFDIHAHLGDARVWEQATAVLADSAAHGLTGVLANAARREEWERVIALARRAGPPKVWAAVGIHPFFLEDWGPGTAVELAAALRDNPGTVRAVGEIGLDFWQGRDGAAEQAAACARQCEIAAEFGVPVIVHNRKSWNEFFALWKALAHRPPAAVCHHFSGSLEIARQALDFGMYLSFCGPLTYPGARRLRAAAELVPWDRVLTETDTPDLPAAAWRGRESRPWQVRAVLETLAEIKRTPLEVAAAHVAANFARVLRLRGTESEFDPA